MWWKSYLAQEEYLTKSELLHDDAIKPPPQMPLSPRALNAMRLSPQRLQGNLQQTLIEFAQYYARYATKH